MRYLYSATRRSLGIVALVGCAANTRPTAPAPGVVERLIPGRGEIEPPAFGGATTVAVFMKRPDDSTARRVGAFTISETVTSSAGARVVLVRAWPKPFSSIDTLAIDPRTLEPRDEALAFNGSVFRYHYHGSRVTGTVTSLDSAPQPYDHDFGEPLFAFNEVETLVRSLAFHRGLNVVVPLFSETDRALERDTLTVLDRQKTSDGFIRWVVRFADPAIATRYVVDARSRTILDATTTQRASHVELQYRYAGAG